MRFKKTMTLLLSFALLSNFNFENTVTAVKPSTVGKISSSIFNIFSVGGIVQTAVRWVIGLTSIDWTEKVEQR